MNSVLLQVIKYYSLILVYKILLIGASEEKLESCILAHVCVSVFIYVVCDCEFYDNAKMPQ